MRTPAACSPRYTRAMRCYEQVAAFEGNPLIYEARDSLNRVRGLAAKQ